jgi:NAD(P)-dependent dehydrogenase (short-subunit alcohol dehydrogenase family)
MQRLKSRVAIVTGASRGAGRGIAGVLGGEGATVYVTGRSVREVPTRPDLPGMAVEDTAELVASRGGVGIAVRCDHTVDGEVEALFDKVAREQGYLDLLVNNVWGGYEEYGGDEAFDAPFWEQPLWRWDKMFQAGVRAHYAASRLAVPLMAEESRAFSRLIVNTTFWDRGKCLSNLPYDLAKTAVNRLAYVMALELREQDIAAVALSPGWMRSEAVLQHYGTDEAHWQEVADLAKTESTQYIGRAVAALAADRDVMAKSGRVLTVGDLAREYGFTDVDGRQPPAFTMAEQYLRD